jgi:hypothetical protein
MDGSGGTGASGGMGATGGTGAAVCLPSTGTVDVILVGSDGHLVTTSVDDQVVVASVGLCAGVGCTPVTLPNGAMIPVPTTDLRIVLDRSNGGPLTLYLKVPQMPLDALKVGETYDLTAAAGIDAIFETTVDQTVTLLRGGRLVVFAAQLRKFGVPLLPDLHRAGVVLEDGGLTCDQGPGGSVSFSCGVRQHAVRVTTTTGGSAVVQPRQTTEVADLSFTSDSYDEYVDSGFCDTKSVTRMAAFASGPCAGTAPGCAGGP